MEKKMSPIYFFLFKIFYYSFLKFLYIQKVLMFINGWDTLNPFAPHSYGGVPRKKFLVLYRKKRNSIEITQDEYNRAKWGSLNPTKEQFSKVFEIQDEIRKNYSFKKDGS